MVLELLEGTNLFAAGVLVGEELCIRFGISRALASLADVPHIQLRQALILRLRILVPIVFAVTLFSGAAVTLLGRAGPAFTLRCAGLIALAAFITTALAGTVPINRAVLTWDPAMPPENWRLLIARWQRIDLFRVFASVAAFGLFTTAVIH